MKLFMVWLIRFSICILSIKSGNLLDDSTISLIGKRDTGNEKIFGPDCQTDSEFISDDLRGRAVKSATLSFV